MISANFFQVQEYAATYLEEEATTSSTTTVRTTTATTLTTKTKQQRTSKNKGRKRISNNVDMTKKMTLIGADFIPGPFDVICARGGEARNHIGNVTFRQKIKESARAYSEAESKLYKSIVVSNVVNWFQQRKGPQGGGFVKEVNGTWYEVEEHMAREKAGQALRDQNHAMYKSSTKSKRRRWRQEKRDSNNNKNVTGTAPSTPTISSTTSNPEEVPSTMLSSCKNIVGRPSSMEEKVNRFICRQMETIESQWHSAGGDDASDEMILNMFTQNNLSILSTVSNDPLLQAGIKALLGEEEISTSFGCDKEEKYILMSEL